jgi:hypothetical protein
MVQKEDSIDYLAVQQDPSSNHGSDADLHGLFPLLPAGKVPGKVPEKCQALSQVVDFKLF